MDLEKEIEAVLLKVGQEIIIHKIDDNNSVLEIDYTKYVADLLRVFRNYLSD
jgi:hypothetical protein